MFQKLSKVRREFEPQTPGLVIQRVTTGPPPPIYVDKIDFPKSSWDTNCVDPEQTTSFGDYCAFHNSLSHIFSRLLLHRFYVLRGKLSA